MSKCYTLPGSFCLGLTLLLSGCESSDTPPTQEERQTIYVSPEGRGTGAPSSPTSFTTALALATPGDTIYLVAGEYRPQELPLRIRTDNLTITGAGAEQSTLLLEQANACQLIDIQAQGIQLQHFSIDGSQLDLAPENCAHPALLNVQGDQPQISHLNLRGSNPLPQRGRPALPNERAYSLISLQGSQNTLSVSQLRLDNAAQHSLMLQDALGQIEIHDLHIHHSGYRGLYLYRVDGQIEITDNRVHGAVNEGIYLRDVTGEVSITHNHIENLLYQPTLLGGSGIEGGLVHTNTQGEVFTYIRSNQINIDPQGINRYLSGYPLLDIDGIEVNMLGTARGFAWVEDNTVQNTDDDGIDSDTADQGELDIVIRNNRLMNIQDRSISFVTSGQGVVRGSIEGNHITGPSLVFEHDDIDADGIGMRPRDQSRMYVTVSNNLLEQTGRKGIDINMNRGNSGAGSINQAQAEFLIQDNRIEGAEQRGIDIQLEDAAQATGLIVRNTIIRAQGDGIRVRSGAGDDAGNQRSQLSVAVRDNQIHTSAASGDAGFFGRVQHNASLCLSLENNLSNNSGADFDYLLRSQQDSHLALEGLTNDLAAANPSPMFKDVLISEGNRGRDTDFPTRVQNNPVRAVAQCTFVNHDFTPALPQVDEP